MPDALEVSTRSFRLEPGRAWLDMNADDTARDDNALRRSEHARMDRYIVERRQGSRKVHVFTAPTGGSLTFGTIGKYAAWSQPLVPVGGFWGRISFNAARPASGTSFIVSSTVSGKAYGPFAVTLDSAGLLEVYWYDDATETKRTVVTAAITDDEATHLLFVFDPVAGTWTVYLNGESAGSLTGLTSAMQPMQDGGVVWYFGVDTDGGGTPAAGTAFEGAIDAWCFGALRGADVGGGTPTLLSELRRWTFCEWRNPASRMVLSCFDMNDVDIAGGQILDRSRLKNPAAIAGTPTATSDVAYPAYPGNFLGPVRMNAGRLDNVVIVGGALYYETIRGGTS